MPWQEISTPSPTVVVRKMNGNDAGKINWNDAAQQLMGYPERVDLMYDAEMHRLGFRAGGQYIIDIVADELRYEIVAPDALDAIGLSIQQDYEATPQLVNHEDGEVPGMVGAIYIALPE